jgi:hypothetical protein
MEDFPATVRRMQSADALERAAGLDELMQVTFGFRVLTAREGADT